MYRSHANLVCKCISGIMGQSQSLACMQDASQVYLSASEKANGVLTEIGHGRARGVYNPEHGAQKAIFSTKPFYSL